MPERMNHIQTKTKPSAEKKRELSSDAGSSLIESEKRFSAIFHSNPNAMAIVSKKDVSVLEINDTFCRLCGYNKEEILGRRLNNLEILSYPENRGTFIDAIHEPVFRKNVDFKLHHRSGQFRDVEATITSIDILSESFYLMIFQDITDRIRAEKNLEDKALSLERSNAELRELAGVLSHDLKEPLRTVANFLSLLERRYKGKLDDKADQFISYAVEGAQRLGRLIDNLLALSKITFQGNPFSNVDCEVVFNNTLKALDKAILESGARVSHNPLPTIWADTMQISELFQNLIMNSIKYRSDLIPLIHVSAERKEDDWIFAVRDNGMGIEKEYHGKIFELFERLHSEMEIPGTGIGLTICKKIVERHGGRIWLESEPGRGSVFHFTILSKTDHHRRQE